MSNFGHTLSGKRMMKQKQRREGKREEKAVTGIAKLFALKRKRDSSYENTCNDILFR